MTKDGNTNRIVTTTWSNPGSEELYLSKWPSEPKCRDQYEQLGQQCGGCSYFAPFNSDWGLCANSKSRHALETVFEHFTCPNFTDEGWGPHSFFDDQARHCQCGGETAEFWGEVLKDHQWIRQQNAQWRKEHGYYQTEPEEPE